MQSVTNELQGACSALTGQSIEIYFDLATGNFFLKISGQDPLSISIAELRKLKKTLACADQSHVQWTETKAKAQNLSLFDDD